LSRRISLALLREYEHGELQRTIWKLLEGKYGQGAPREHQLRAVTVVPCPLPAASCARACYDAGWFKVGQHGQR
jgi:hypothetical protein